MSKSIYKLTYYNFKGLGEPIRYIFAVAGVDYKDIQIEQSEATYPKLPAEIKSAIPWGNLPVLEVDGQQIAQSVAIARYLGKKFGLAGETDLENAKCDEVVDAVKDFGNKWRVLSWVGSDEARKAELMAEILKETLPYYLGRFSGLVEKNKSGYLVGNKLTWADLYVVNMLELISFYSKINILNGYPALEAHTNKVFNIPQIKEYIAKRQH